MPKNKVQDVVAMSNDLLRGFEDDTSFQVSPTKISEQPKAENEQNDTSEVERGTGEQTSISQNPKKRGRPPVKESEKIIKKPCNLYLPEKSIEYLQNLGKVLGLNPSDVVSAWIETHRETKYEQVQSALKQLEDRQKLL